MKKLLSFLLTAVLLVTCIAPVYAAEPGIGITVKEETENVYVTVSLQTEITGTAMGLLYTYDSGALEILPEKCFWVQDGILADFDTENHQAAWAAETEMALSGEVCVLVFRKLEGFTSATAISCELTARYNASTIGTYQASVTMDGSCAH